MTVAIKNEVDLDRAELDRLFAAKDWTAARSLSLRKLASSDDRRERLRWLINFANSEWGASRFHVALVILDECAQLLGAIGDEDEVRANYHASLALVCRALGRNDRAIVEYTGAAYYHKLAGREGMLARVENNLAYVLAEVGRGDEAVERAESALRRFVRLGDYQSAAEAALTLGKAYRALTDGEMS